MTAILYRAFFRLTFFPVLLFASVAELDARTVSDDKLGFSLELSSEFIERPDLVEANPNMDHAFQFGEAEEGEAAVIFFIGKMDGTIGPEIFSKEDVPPEFEGQLLVSNWQGFEVNVIEVPELLEGVSVLTYNAQVPLKHRAVQVSLFGPAAQKALLNSLLAEVLGGLDGESNWRSSAQGTVFSNSGSESESYGLMLFVLAIVGVIAGLVILWLVSKKAPKGTVLGIAAILYLGSWLIDDTQNREIRLLSGVMRTIGFAGGILGVVELMRKRKSEDAAEKVGESES